MEGARLQAYQEWKKRLGWLVVSLRRLAEVRHILFRDTAKLVRPGHPFAFCFTFPLSSINYHILTFQIGMISPGEYAAGVAMRRLTNVFDYAGGSLGTVRP